MWHRRMLQCSQSSYSSGRLELGLGKANKIRCRLCTILHSLWTQTQNESQMANPFPRFPFPISPSFSFLATDKPHRGRCAGEFNIVPEGLTKSQRNAVELADRATLQQIKPLIQPREEVAAAAAQPCCGGHWLDYLPSWSPSGVALLLSSACVDFWQKWIITPYRQAGSVP